MPAPVQTQRGMGVFGDGFHRDAADFVQRAAAQDGARAAEEGGIPHIVAVLHQPVEQGALVGRLTEAAKVALEGIRREEVVRGLQHRQLFVFEEPPHGQLQEGARRDVVAVENRHELAGGLLQRVVDVAGLGVFVSRPGDVLHSHLGGERPELGAIAVIKDIDVHFLFRPVDAQRRIDGGLHHPEVFVVGRHHQIDGRPGRTVFGQRHRLAVKRPDSLEIAQHQHHPGVGFRHQQQQAADQAERIVPVQRGGIAPPQVTAGDGQRQHDQHQRRQAPRHPAHHHRDPPQQQNEHELRRQIERLRDAQHGEDRRQHADQNEQRAPQSAVHAAESLYRALFHAGVFQPQRQALQPIGIALLQPPPTGEIIALHRRAAAAEQQQPRPLQQIAQRIRRAGTFDGQVREPVSAAGAHTLPGRRLEAQQQPPQRHQQRSEKGGQRRRAVAAIGAVARLHRLTHRRHQQQAQHPTHGATPGLRLIKHQLASVSTSSAARLSGRYSPSGCLAASASANASSRWITTGSRPPRVCSHS
ncbi:Uncharacterised protein [Acinetobacter baumannii]|nr:Uncharacterised protein [Acinetobacter baumannii]